MIKIRQFENYKKSNEFTSKEAYDILERNIKVPKGWYLHGRNNTKEFANSEWPTQFTKDIEIALSYGKNGSVWIARPTKDADVLDFSSEHSSDMNKFIKNLKKFFDKSDETYIEGFDEIKTDMQLSQGINEITFEDFEEEVRKSLCPKNIVDSAEGYDNSTWWGLLTYSGGTYDSYPDFIITPDGAVLIPGSNKIEAVNLTELAEGYIK